MAAFTIPTIGTYWRNVQSEHQTKLEWQVGKTYTYEMRRESGTNDIANRPSPFTSDYTATGQSINHGYAWNEETGAGKLVNPLLNSSQEFSFQVDPFNDLSPIVGASEWSNWKTVTVSTQFPASSITNLREQQRVLDFSIGQDAISATSAGSATLIPDNDLLITGYPDGESTGYWTEYSITVDIDAIPANYNLVAIKSFYDISVDWDGGGLPGNFNPAFTISNHIVTDREEINVAVYALSQSPSAEFPVGRVQGYDEDAVWDPDGDGGDGEGTGGWTSNLADLTTTGGGRYGRQIVVVSNKARIFFGDL